MRTFHAQRKDPVTMARLYAPIRFLATDLIEAIESAQFIFGVPELFAPTVDPTGFAYSGTDFYINEVFKRYR